MISLTKRDVIYENDNAENPMIVAWNMSTNSHYSRYLAFLPMGRHGRKTHPYPLTLQ
jgi:hypothetical protein